MKKIYLLIILLISIFSFAQETKYIITISNLNYRINKGVKNSTSSNIKIIIHYQNGTSTTAYYRSIGSSGDNETSLNIDPVNNSTKPVSIECYAFVNFRTGTDANGSKFINVDSYCPNGTFDGDYSPRMSHITFNYKIEPTLDVFQGTSDFLPTDENITINSLPGYDTGYYKWQYTLNPSYNNTTDWIDFTKYNTSSISTNAIEVLGADAGLKHGQKIYFRLKPCGTVTGKTITYSIRLSAPKIISSTPDKVSCYDLGSDDGKLKLQFNRSLYPGETFSIALLGTSTQNFLNITQLNPDNTYVLSGLARGNYKITTTGFYNGNNTYSTYTELGGTPYPFMIEAPDLLDFSLKSSDILCYGANNGSITIAPTGGTRDVLANDYYSLDNGYSWIPFPNNKPYTITGLSPGIYKIKVKDMNGCIARIQTVVEGKVELGEEKIIEATITEPLSPLALNYTFKQDPTFNGAFNGKITASISGGTIKDDKSYDYKWVKTTGEEFTGTTQYNEADKTFTISLENAPAGEYKLTVTDKNYEAAINKTNCSIIESSQVLTQPEPIKITLAETQSISCNTENGDTDADKFSDGILTASVKGGIPPYQYVWSKLNASTNAWDVLSEQLSDTAINLSKGNYSLNVIDKNGITQGTYSTTDLVTAIPAIKEIIEPAKLELSFDSGNISCHDGNNGWAKANVAGGLAPYTYAWYNVDGIINGNEISQLTAGEYFVEITDKKGCFIKGSIVVTEPQSAVLIDYKEITAPAFSGATNGKIVAEVTGGTPNNDGTYFYEWKNSAGVVQTAAAEIKDGIYTISLNGIPADKYLLTIKDKNYNEGTSQIINCSVLESEVKLTEPDPLKVVFEIVRSISCNVNNEFGNDKDTAPKDGQRDESQDGILVAHVTGGTPLASSANSGLPYYFYWKKQQADGSRLTLPMIKDSIASNLSHGNYALNIKDRNGIVLGTYINNQLVEEIDVTQLMQEPPKLTVAITKGDVFCNGGNDGWATANVAGGTPPYDYKWSNDVESDKNMVLKAGEYWVFITDAKGCTTQESVTITEPKAPLKIKYTEVINPSFYKATNGKITAEVAGGTISADNSYWYEWKNSKGIIQTATTSFNDGIYTISLNGIPEETYTLNIHDSNYDIAANKSSCNISNSVITLEEPDPLEVTFEIVRTISCNASNEFGNETDNNPQDNQRDESQDGILTAHVKGGIQLQADKNNGLPYFYTWKKKQNDSSWKIWNEETETLNNISEGTYALNIEDANGIKLGTYTNNILIKETDAVQYIGQPAKLNLTFTKLNASCDKGDDGWAEAHVSGGTAPYTYEWTSGETTSKIENITTNNYFVLVTDAKGCVVQGSIFVGDPKGILTTETVKNPTCFSGNDGSIQLNVSGGNLPYTYLWNTGATTKDLNNLSAGNYEVTISCPDCCVYKKRFVLKDPNPIIVDLGKDRTLCNDQVLDLDATIADKNAKYSWTSTNGFTSNQAKVSLTKAGTYHVKATSALGCVGEDEIVIKSSQAIISSEFLLSSQAYLDEEVILVNTSNPFGESTKWIIPEGVKTVELKEKYITLKFNDLGTYTIGLQQTQGECFAIYNKNITVEQRSTLPNAGSAPKFIIDFIVTPNPSNGNFKALINLENNSAVNLRLFSTTGEFTMQKKDSGRKNYEVDFNTSLQSGMYLLVLETEQQTLVKKIIIY
ncbi:T9SS type A sorting domain-containing protein [Flavobacterium soyae]|uniref:T9SS type A sorting domain-containing protein n=1 Tax=Flavobacterium soyae TaxID=2903098 RepID=UPI001E2CB54E|nr:T9SS type A sorting domain-containing protein [Flavobacterium soyae]MCD9576645.1 T9SS type A sorting domain-containing protein [Flavobacterium soyae]